MVGVYFVEVFYFIIIHIIDYDGNNNIILLIKMKDFSLKTCCMLRMLIKRRN